MSYVRFVSYFQGCMSFAGYFLPEQGFKLQSDEDVVSDVDLEECAKMCLQSKHCTCNSFSHNANKRRCVLGNRCVGLFRFKRDYSNYFIIFRYSANSPYDALLERKSWNYYQLNPETSSEVTSGCGRVKRPASSPIEAIRLISEREAELVEVKVNGTWGGVCDDGFSFNEAHVVCRQMGFPLGAQQV